ncbi:MAG: aldolase/citrate lyase family protein [Geminicoccaceae bacterium]|nr:aldolase/citrate lyase family protein [Geminicoccaceae bacterium]MCX8101382.1 aldolase/citrate lyase family protein [Geminicoccaceae bacterium]MDW8370724.1 aldolase/citrate lyase family protein [Geminicoccaceae bacterium]
MDGRPCVRERLARGERVVGTMVFEVFTPGLPAILAAAGLDFVVLDTEHSGVGIDTLKTVLACARGLPLEVYVRVPEKSYAAVATVLDAGARGILVPMLETAEEARALVEWVRYRPEGKRGCAFGMAHDDYRAHDVVAYMAEANRRNLVMGLIETRKGIENVEAIAAVPGLDVLWLGHFDLTNDMGITAQFDHPEFWAAAHKLIAAAGAQGKTLAAADANLAYLEKLARLGFTMLGYGPDIAVLREGLRQGAGKVRAFSG